ncbi:carbon storage regulator [Lacunimicrobium album]|jgi:carbon storage regulator
MLVLSRKSGEKIQIGENISLTIVRIGPNSVRIGIEAPREMSILREELQPTQANAVIHQDMTLASKAS